MNTKLNFMIEANKFADISHKYATSKDLKEKKECQIKIKEIIINTSEMVKTYFKTSFLTEKKGFATGKKGVLMTAPNINRIIDSMQNNVVLNPSRMIKYKTVSSLKNGAVFLMDYSGSMWFDECDDTFDGVSRIHMQNLIVLTLTRLLQKINKTKVILISYSQSPVLFESKDILAEDLDLFIVNKHWGSLAEGEDKLFGVPNKLKEICSHNPYQYERWLSSEYPKKAVDLSLQIIQKDNIKKYAYMIFTDGGMHRIGETQEDRVKFIKDLFFNIKANTEESLFEFVFIKTQSKMIQNILKNIGENYSVFDDVESVNNAFEVISNSIFLLFNNIKR